MGEDNLKPFNKLTEEEQRRISSKGGKASGEARRKKKLMKDQIELLLSLPFPDVQDRNGKKIKTTFKQLGLNDENIDNQMAMVVAMWQRALKGDVSAFNTLRDTVGEKPKENISVEDKREKTKKLDNILEQLKE